MAGGGGAAQVGGWRARAGGLRGTMVLVGRPGTARGRRDAGTTAGARREGQRQVLLAARYESIARLMLRVFEEDTPNLLMPPAQLQELMAEGAHLIGAGLLDVVTSQEGKVSAIKVIGLMGTLLAAREYLRRHPEALLVSTDSQLARTWLRLGTQGNRCDLLGIARGGRGNRAGVHRGKDDETRTSLSHGDGSLAGVRTGPGNNGGGARRSRRHHGGGPVGAVAWAAPRNEMLKEVLVQGCMGRFATGGQRARWAGWLTRIFGPAPRDAGVAGDRG